jgi:hypothetical protein
MALPVIVVPSSICLLLSGQRPICSSSS